MNEPKTIEEVPNWVIVNALRCPVNAQISIVAKLLQHLNPEERAKALSLAGISKLPFYWAVTGTFHGAIIEAETEGDARRIFHKKYKGESIINIKKRNGYYLFF